MAHPAIIYNCSYNGLSIIQELGSRDIPCLAVDCIYSIGAFSKWAEFRHCPDPIEREQDFIDMLYGLCARQPVKPVLFPTNDEWALVTAKYRERLAEVAYPCVADYETVRTLLSKDVFYDVGQKNGYMTPKTWANDALSDIRTDQFPVVAKPRYKSVPHGANNANINKGLKKNRLVVFQNQNQLNTFISDHAGLLPHLVFQEYIPGDSSNMFTVGIYANRENEIKAVFTGRKVRGYPADIGDNIVGESHSVPNSLIENTERIVRELAFEGIAEFEYKRDPNTGSFRLIEINPRPWSWIGITPYCGVNIPYIAYQSLLGEETGFHRSVARDGEVKYIKIYQDIANCLFRYRFNYPPWHMSYRQWRKGLAGSKLVVAEHHKGDWPILFASIPYLIGKLLTQRLR
jgi:D-aspartate ligase